MSETSHPSESAGADLRRAAEPTRKFERQLPDDRRRELVAATIRCLAREGHDGLSIRRIAQEAGVSIGLINHHFPSKTALVAEAYRSLAHSLSGVFAAALAEAPPGPRARLSAYFAASFSDANLDPDILHIWTVFWSLSRHQPEVAEVHHETYRATLELLTRLIGDLTAEAGLADIDPALSAIGLNAMLDGLWLEWCLNPRTFSPAEGLRLCERWVDQMILGAGQPLARCPG
ncbi:MAG: TetR family transcriptional regulator C-terminal domain-containing protein [Hyphomicrobiaceae bacterium]